MKAFLTCALLLIALAGCTSESDLPNPTGKGTIRVINALPTAPQINALIEERSLGVIGYKQSTNLAPYDDFDYVFNFDAVLAGNSGVTRIASLPLKIEKDVEFTLFLSGDVANPTVTIESQPERDFDANTAVAEMRFAHFAEGAPAVDLYFAAPGVTPALGQEVATLAYGDITDAEDFPLGDYVLFITPAGDPATILFESTASTFANGIGLLFTVLAPDANDVDRLAVRAYTNTGGTVRVADVEAESTLRFIHGAIDAGPVDVYLDEALTTVIASNVPFRGVTGDFPVEDGALTLYLTPAGDTTTILFQTSLAIANGTRTHISLLGDGGNFAATAYNPDRRSIETAARLQVLNLSINLPVINIYLVDRGATVTENDLPRTANTASGATSAIASVTAEGSYDAYATISGTQTPVAGPFPLDIEFGDVIDLVVFDTADPLVGTIDEIPDP